MELKPIRTKAEYKMALAEAEALGMPRKKAPRPTVWKCSVC